MLKYLFLITLILGLNTSHAYNRNLKFKRPVHLQLEKLKLENFFKRFRCKHTSTKFKCVEPIRNYDGDTITVNIPNIHELFGKEIPVRLLGIDTAEIRTSDECEKEMAEKAKDFVENELLNATTIHLYNIERDKYFRVAADVIIDGKTYLKN